MRVGRVCFGDFKYQHWLPEIAYPTFNIQFLYALLSVLGSN